MIGERQEKWLQALESGKYEQTTMQLCDAGKYCCLGVACELVRNGVIGKITRCAVNCGPPGVPCDRPEEAMEPGLDWDL